MKIYKKTTNTIVPPSMFYVIDIGTLGEEKCPVLLQLTISQWSPEVFSKPKYLLTARRRLGSDFSAFEAPISRPEPSSRLRDVENVDFRILRYPKNQ